ncbi:MAG: hypothetical protein JF886_02205 [Candidatus Dormibacteraeota bacterium]|uniref:Uncharacterized protein n=1 Tax=Candidatus Aeolococcus gillhamiae TaxID=3127015 RepID=A0A2W5Z0P5_9BACT|nr:hypothetical protein [Candidatus Dormibacteraeota bacterium]PZR78843.1 MAG: hypothetical protein DLM65_12000 [Candidatus Dormibacter sp. RRmetagenome_bin12]
MSDPKPDAGELGDQLQSYFAVTTATPLPRGVADMSARTLPVRRRSMARWFAGATGALATAALVVLVGTHALPHGGGAALSSGAAGAATFGPANAAPRQSLGFVYPGVDTALLAQHGVRLLPPAGLGTAVLSATQAQQAASAAAGPSAGTPGPAVLADAELSAPAAPTSCLCWAVDVPVGAQSGPAASAGHTRLVLIDAVTGRAVAVLSGNGIP